MRLLNADLVVKEVVPSVVIFGIGDSGTRGVKVAMQNLGVHMCHSTNPSQDNLKTMVTQTHP